MSRVTSINVGRPRTVEWVHEDVSTAIFKRPVQGLVAVRGVNVAGDDQADRSVHGGEFKAVYAYAQEDYGWWSTALGIPLEPGQFGENLTLQGVDVNATVIGEQWRIGADLLLQVTQPRLPCFKLGIRMNAPGFPGKFAMAKRFGVYFTIVEEGEIQAGDRVEVISKPENGWTIRRAGEVYLFEPRELHRLADVPHLAPTFARGALSKSEAWRSRTRGTPAPWAAAPALRTRDRTPCIDNRRAASICEDDSNRVEATKVIGGIGFPTEATKPQR
jgi:MOSC domain-containing protein YiiM